MQLSRWVRHALTPVAVLVLVATAALGLPHTEKGHDADCTLIAVAHDAAAHRIGAASTHDTAPPVHCLACHWLRSLSRPSLAGQCAPQATARLGLRADTPALLSLTVAARPPLRGPPFPLTSI